MAKHKKKMYKIPYKKTSKKRIKRMVRKTPELKKEDVIFKKAVESKKTLESELEPKKEEPIKAHVEFTGEVEARPVEEPEIIRLPIENVPVKETFINKALKKLKSIFRKKQVWEGYRLSKNP